MARTKQGLALEALAEKVKRHDASKMVTVNTKVPGDVMSVVDAMAKHLKVTRSDVLRMLLKAALVEGLAETGADAQRALRKAGANLDVLRRLA